MPPLPPLPAGFDIAAEFPIVTKWTFLNHAAVAPICARAADALKVYARDAANDAYLSGQWYQQADDTRARAARLIGAAAEEVAFVKNTSEGIAFVANGLDWSAGDEVVSTAVEYPANVYPWMNLARLGVRLIQVPEDNGRIDPQRLLDAVSERTRLIALSHVQYASGFRSDLARIGTFCRERGILFCVDAIQSVGVLPVDVRAMNIDYLSADGHKWMLGPEGCGIFFCRKELIAGLRPEVGWLNVVDALNYGHYDFTLRGDAKRFECGTYNIPGILALNASLKLLEEIGIPTIAARVQALTAQFADGVSAKGYRVIGSSVPEERSGIVAFTSSALDHATIQRELLREKIVVALREGRLRVSPHFYNTAEQIARVVEALPGH